MAASTGPDLHSDPSLEALERGDHGNSALYLRHRHLEQAAEPIHVAFPCGARPVTATVLEIAVAAGISLFLGIVLAATYAAAAMSRCQERMQEKVREAQAETARVREDFARRMTVQDSWPAERA